MQACNGRRGILRALSGFGAQPNPLVWEFKWLSIYMENLDDDDDYYGKGLNYLLIVITVSSLALNFSQNFFLVSCWEILLTQISYIPPPLLQSWKLVALLN